MSKVNIQNRKLNIIEQLITLDDDLILKQVEDLINITIHKPSLKRLTQQELINRAKQSEKDIANGDIYSQEDVEKLSENW